MESKIIWDFQSIWNHYDQNKGRYYNGAAWSIKNKPDKEFLDVFIVDEDNFWITEEENLIKENYLFSCKRENLQEIFENIPIVEMEDFHFYLKHQKDKKFKKKVIKAKELKTILVL